MSEEENKRTWVVGSRHDPDTDWIRISFKRSGNGDDGHISYEPLSEEGEDWLQVVREYLESKDITLVTESGEILEGPHHHTERQLAGALDHLSTNFPTLRVREPGAGGEREVAIGIPDARLEATKTVIRERFLEAFEELSEEKKPLVEKTIQEMLVPIVRATSPRELEQVLQDALKQLKDEPGLKTFGTHAADRLQLAIGDSDLPIYREPIESFVHDYYEWLIVK